jgi:hypothetical protein
MKSIRRKIMVETNNNHWEVDKPQKKNLDRKLDAVGWGLFFIWIGIAILADVGWGVGLMGVGLIILGGLVAREYLSGSGCSGTNRASF